MLQNLRKRNEGFTIIEVLIVLAIAGLIMLVVFLAVPALQRNSRNTQIKSAASAILGVVNEYQDVNSGQMPTTVAISNGTITASGATGTTPATGKTQSGYSASIAAFPTTAANNTGEFRVGIDQKCNGNTGFTATPRAIAVGFIVETGSGEATQCVES